MIFERFGWVLEGFGKDLGRVWEGFWEGFGRAWGRIWDDFERSGHFGCLGVILGLFSGFLHVFSSILCNFTCFGPVRLRVGGFEPGSEGLGVEGQGVKGKGDRFRAFLSHRFSSLRLHASTALIIFRASRSLLRQVYLEALFAQKTFQSGA